MSGVIKKNMDNVFALNAKSNADRADRMKKAAKPVEEANSMVDKVNSQLSGNVQGADKIEKEISDMDIYSKQDLELAEELLFNKYVKKDMLLTKTKSAAIYTVSAAEMDLVNDMIFDFAKNNEDEDGNVNVSQRKMDTLQQLYVLAVAFEGFDTKDIASDRSIGIELIKRSIVAMDNVEVKGDIKAFNNMKEEIKKAIKKRAYVIRQLSATIIDVLSKKRFEFESMVSDILSRGDILPKS